MKILQRLERPLTGEFLFGFTDIILQLEKRAAWVDPPLPIPDRTKEINIEIKQNKKTVSIYPYAPQLIRIVKFPYSMSPWYPRKIQVREPIEKISPRQTTPRIADMIEHLETSKSPVKRREYPKTPKVELGLAEKWCANAQS